MNIVTDNDLLAMCRNAQRRAAAEAYRARMRRLPLMNRAPFVRLANAALTTVTVALVVTVCWLVAERL